MDNVIDTLAFVKDAIDKDAKAVSALKNIIDENFLMISQWIFACKGRLIFTGMGKSAIIAQKATATFNSIGISSSFLHASDAFHGDFGIIQEEDLIFIFSKSGNSPEIKSFIQVLANSKNKFIGITCNPQSELTQLCSACLIAPTTEESTPLGLAPTTSALQQLVLADSLAIAQMVKRNIHADFFAKFHPGGQLGKSLTLQVSQLILHNECPSVQLSTSLKDVINSITEGRLGATAVIDEHRKILGIITDGDVRRLLQNISNLEGIFANEMMTKSPKTIDKNALATSALALMQEKDITQLIATNEDQTLAGFVHLHDLLDEGL